MRAHSRNDASLDASYMKAIKTDAQYYNFEA